MATLFEFFLAILVGDVLRVRRSHVESAMTRAGIHDPSGTARRMYRHLGRGVVELVRMALRTPGGGLRGVLVPSATIAELLGRGRGAVIATAHTGNWDLCACAVAEVAPLSVITKRLRIRWLDALWQGIRRRRSLKLLVAEEAARGALSALQRGELVAMLVDQAPERRRGVVSTEFLGGTVWVDLAPALVSMRARAPLVVAFPRRQARREHAIDVLGILEPPKVPSRAWANAAMQEATRLLEDFVRRQPEQWLWMHRRWKAPPESRPCGRPGLVRLARGSS